jgi:cytochrome c biogenesis protein CcmG/thiol:disulfide interchange protein DsbE
MFIGLIITIPFVALLAFGLGRDPRLIPSPLPGRDAPEFLLAVLDTLPPNSVGSPGPGDLVRLSSLRGEVVVVNFWASWCLACQDEHAILSRSAEWYRDDSVRFFGIVYSDTPANATRWIARMGGQSYPALLDPRSSTAIQYGLYGVPETYFIGRDGRVAHKIVGPVTMGDLTHWIDRLLAADSLATSSSDLSSPGEATGESPSGSVP